ncbi:MAG TPA: 3-oxoacyl-ACP synthase, partial [Anaerolineae bacterium]|nr:3-oxoacyl-ACP synthase [Anaerolineae bacterium]
MTNFDLEKIVDTNDEWITKMTGIKERRIISEGETASSMAVEATNKALEVAGLTPADLDLIIVASSSPDYLVPAVSSTVQYKLGADCP